MDGYLDDTGFDPYDYYPGVPAQIVPRKEPMSPEEQEEFDTFWSQMKALEIEGQGERAKELCACSSFVTSAGRIRPMFCGNFRVCERCFKYRVGVWRKRLRLAMEQYARDHPGAVWQYKEFSHEYATAARRSGIPYLSFPVEGGVTIIVSPEIADGETVPALDFSLTLLMERWAMTPRKMRPSRSRRFVPKKPERTEPPQPMLIASATTSKVGAVAETAGAEVTVLADGLTREFIQLDMIELALELLLQEIAVKLVANSAITPLRPYDTIFEPIWRRRAEKAENDPPAAGDGLR